MPRFHKILALAFIIILSACTNELPEYEIVPSKEAEMDVFIDRLKEEAEARNVTLDWSNFEREFVSEIFKDGYYFCGYGYTDYDGFGTRRIEIVKNRNCWDDQSETFKEILVFHEIGHAILGRPHIWNSLPDGSDISLMCGDQFCNTFGVYNRFQEYKRDYYIDELLGVEEGIPDWAYAKTEVTPIDATIFGVENWNRGNGGNFFIDVSEEDGSTVIHANRSSPLSASFRKGFEYSLDDNRECDNYRFIVDATFKNVRGLISPYIEIEAFRSDNSFDIIHFDRSYFSTPMKGTGTRTEVTVEISCIAQEMDRIRCYVAFPSDFQGEISFSNFRLERAR